MIVPPSDHTEAMDLVVATPVFLAREGLSFGGARRLATDEVGLAVPRTAETPATMSV